MAEIIRAEAMFQPANFSISSLINHRHAQFFGLVELRSRVGSCHNVVVFLLTDPETRPPASSIICLAWSRV